MKGVALFSSIVALFVLAVWAGQATQRPVCIPSPHVKSLDIQLGSSSLRIPDCNEPLAALEVPKHLREFVNQLNTSLSIVDREWAFMGQARPLIIEIDWKRPQHLRFGIGKLEVGIDHFSSQQKVIEILWEAQVRALAVEALVGTEVLPSTLGRVARALVKGPESCWDDGTLASHLARPLCRVVSQMGFNRRRMSLVRLPLNLRFNDWAALEPHEPYVATQLATIPSEISKRLLSLELEAPLSQVPASAELLVQIAEGASAKVMAPFWSGSQSIWIANANRVKALGSKYEMIASAPSTKNKIMIACSDPTIGEIESHSKGVERLLVVRSCKSENAVRVAGWMNGSLAQFAEENPNLAFRVYHLPSLKVGMQMGLRKGAVLSPENIMTSSREFSKIVRGLLYSGKTLRDEARNYYWNPGPLSALEYFRDSGSL